MIEGSEHPPKERLMFGGLFSVGKKQAGRRRGRALYNNECYGKSGMREIYLKMVGKFLLRTDLM